MRLDHRRLGLIIGGETVSFDLLIKGALVFPGDRPHPRLYGTVARVLGRYALKERLIPVEEAVARLTARAADRIGLTDRGRIREGLRADVVLLDPHASSTPPPTTIPSASPRVSGGCWWAVERFGQTAHRPVCCQVTSCASRYPDAKKDHADDLVGGSVIAGLSVQMVPNNKGVGIYL